MKIRSHTIWFLTSETAGMIRFVQQRLQSLWCLDKSHPAEQTWTSLPKASLHHSLPLLTFDLAGGWRGALGKLGSGVQIESPKTWRYLATKALRTPLTTEHIAASKTRKAPAFGAKKFSDDSTPPSFLLTAKLELFMDNRCFSKKQTWK